jgi:hypothetical protein
VMSSSSMSSGSSGSMSSESEAMSATWRCWSGLSSSASAGGRMGQEREAGAGTDAGSCLEQKQILPWRELLLQVVQPTATRGRQRLAGGSRRRQRFAA